MNASWMGTGCCSRWGPCNKLNAVDPKLESAWFQPLSLKCDLLVSKFAFKFSLCRYAKAKAKPPALPLSAQAGLCTS